MKLLRMIFGGSELKGLTGDAIFSLLIKVLAMLLSFSVIVLINRVASVAEFGAYMYALSIISLLRIVSVFGGERWLVREVATSVDEPNSSNGYHLKNGVLVVSMSASIIIAVGLYVAIEFAPWLFNDDALKVVKLSLLLLPLVTLVTVYQAYIRGLHRAVVAQIPDAIIRPILMVSGLLMLGFLTTITLSATELMSLQITSTLLVFVILTWVSLSIAKKFSHSNVSTEKFAYSEFLRAGVTLVFIAVVIRGSSFVINIMLGNLGTVTDVALFSVSKRVSDLVTFMQAAIVMPLAPMIAKKFKQSKQQELMKLAVAASWGGLIFALPVSVVLIVFPELILSVFGNDYSAAVNVLQIMVITQLITVSLGPVTVWLTMTKNEGAAIKAAVLGFVTLITVAYISIPEYGAVGGALSFSSGLLVTQLVMLAYVATRVKVDSSIFGLRYLFSQRK